MPAHFSNDYNPVLPPHDFSRQSHDRTKTQIYCQDVSVTATKQTGPSKRSILKENYPTSTPSERNSILRPIFAVDARRLAT